MNAAVTKKTQDTLGNVIKKPPLTEKLLSKPPFRYLHDILSEVIRTTGFMKGLYGEAEMKSDNVKEKESKIAFLQKAIDVVTLVTGEQLSVKPVRIVAGHEPEKTNELLQAIGRCCLNKLSSEEAVRRVLAGEKLDPKGKAGTSTSQDKENRESREREKKEVKDRSSSRDRKDPEQSKEQKGKTVEKDRHRDRTKERERGHAKDRDRTKERERDKMKDGERERNRTKDSSREQIKERPQLDDRDKRQDRDKDKESERHKETDRKRDRNRDKLKEREDARERHREGDEKETDGDKARNQDRTRDRQPDRTLKIHQTQQDEQESPARIPRPSSAKGQRRRPRQGGQEESDSDGETPSAAKPPHLENGDMPDAPRPHTAQSNRRVPRPGSARPAPPRVKAQENYTEASSLERQGSGRPSAAVIMEGKRLSEDEEDNDAQFVGEETLHVTLDMPHLQMDASLELQGDEKHGGLVKKILETKKDYEASSLSPMNKDQGFGATSDAARRKERELVAREVERLRGSIQTLCRSALPLGKIMDYLQEDVDAMQVELQAWRRENREHAQALMEEQRATEQSTEALRADLAELDQMIQDEKDKICAVRANVLRNEEKIQKMVSNISFSART